MKKLSIAIGFMVALMLSALSICAQTQSREDLLKDISVKRAELARLEKAFLSPSEEDRARYAEFLNLPNTGLFRLLPREVFDSSSPDKQLTIRGGGAYYSFKERSHEYINSTAIGLEQGYLQTIFGGANYAMLASLGDVSLDTVSLEATAAQVLSHHTPAPDLSHARVEQRRWQEGVTLDGISYSSRLPLKLNTTYVLRSVLYDTSDLIVAFRVVRIDNDDSATIAWKLLKKYPTPHMDRN